MSKMRTVFLIMRSIKIKFIIFTFALLVIYLLLFHFYLGKWLYRDSGHEIYSSVVLNYVVVHFDLKGAPPKLHYLESLLPNLKELGVNGILMEYEDMFPYEGRLVNLSARNCYDKNELNNFLSETIRSGIEVIPLVQTFGHMEHALKLQEFKYLREQSKYPDSICPSKPDSKELIKDMLEQVINFHTSIAPLKHIHIGCDEVYHINKCTRCRRNNKTNIEIFSNHLHTVNNIVTKISPHTTVLIWDDMLRGKAGLQIDTMNFKNFEPVYWDYKSRILASDTDLYRYHKKFDNIWIASAFKGADGRTATFPNFKNRFINNFSWLDFIMNYKFGGESDVYYFKGIILTGWSRYSHMDPLCELLPTSMPSLILNLILIKTMKKGIVHGDLANMDFDDFFEKYLLVEFSKYIKCKNLIYIDNFDSSGCSFDNSDIYNLLRRYFSIMTRIKLEFDHDNPKCPAIEYYSKIKTINVNGIHYCMKLCSDCIKQIKNLKTELRIHMSKYFEDDAIDEYILYKTYQSETKLRNTMKTLDRYMDTRSWNRRPLETNISAT